MGARGATAVSLPFVLPPFLLVVGVAILYAKYQGLDAVHAIFLGVPAVLAVIAIAAVKLARATNRSDPVLWLIGGSVCAVTAISGAEIAALFLLAGAFGAIYYGGGSPRLRAAASLVPLGPVAVVKGLAWTGPGVSGVGLVAFG